MKNLYLILPVYYGGDKFNRALRSIAGCLNVFDLIVISINGGSNSVDEQILSNYNFDERPNVVIFRTEMDLSPVDHAKFIVRGVNNLFEIDGRIMFLAHDDELIKENLLVWKRNIFPNASPTEGFIGDYYVCNEMINSTISAKNIVRPLQNINSDSSLEVLGWLRYLKNLKSKHTYTNMSGMIVPVKVYYDYIRFQNRTFGKIGARFEYMLLSHHSISRITSIKAPIVRVYEHLNQEGRNVPKVSYYLDEVRYLLWLILNLVKRKKYLVIFSSSVNLKDLPKNLIMALFLGFKSKILTQINSFK